MQAADPDQAWSWHSTRPPQAALKKPLNKQMVAAGPGQNWPMHLLRHVHPRRLEGHTRETVAQLMADAATRAGARGLKRPLSQRISAARASGCHSSGGRPSCAKEPFPVAAGGVMQTTPPKGQIDICAISLGEARLAESFFTALEGPPRVRA